MFFPLKQQNIGKVKPIPADLSSASGRKGLPTSVPALHYIPILEALSGTSFILSGLWNHGVNSEKNTWKSCKYPEVQAHS